MLLAPLRMFLIPRMPFTDEELMILDGPTASSFVSDFYLSDVGVVVSPLLLFQFTSYFRSFSLICAIAFSPEFEVSWHSCSIFTLSSLISRFIFAPALPCHSAANLVLPRKADSHHIPAHFRDPPEPSISQPSSDCFWLVVLPRFYQ